MRPIFVFQDRHYHQRCISFLLLDALPEHALFDESNRTINVARAGIVLKHIQPQTVRGQFVEGFAQHGLQNHASQAFSGLRNHNPHQLYRTVDGQNTSQDHMPNRGALMLCDPIQPIRIVHPLLMRWEIVGADQVESAKLLLQRDDKCEILDGRAAHVMQELVGAAECPAVDENKFNPAA